MGKFRIDIIAELSRQMRFTPHRTRATQLSAAELLLHEIDPARAYPPAFIVFRITGYRAKKIDTEQLTGLALQHDLGLLIETVSETLDLQATQISEPVLTIDDVTQRFNVTSKTIQRWRRKGLPARHFTFADGKKRVGFLLSSVERFFATHREQVAHGSDFSQVSESERDDILRQARRLAVGCGCCRNEIARRVGRRVSRSPATVLHIIRKHDDENTDQQIFPLAGMPIEDCVRLQILRAARRGVPLKRIARRVHRSRSAVYRILVDERAQKLSRLKMKFIDDELYHQDDAERMIAEISAPGMLEEKVDRDPARLPRELPPHLAELCRAAPLSPAAERALFLKFNYQKFRFVSERRQLDPQVSRWRDLTRLEQLLRNVQETRNELIRANMRLVVSVARKHVRPAVSLMELISEGNLTLMRAVDSFDIHRGFKFSTYATLALMKGFARSVPQLQSGQRGTAGRHQRVGTDEILQNVPDRGIHVSQDRLAMRDQLDHLLGMLDQRERRIVSEHFGLQNDSPKTLDQLSQSLGLSAQRIRQIEQSALLKIRRAAGVTVDN
jgi:RNA polymerase sigma factor (sigma-70 family)